MPFWPQLLPLVHLLPIEPTSQGLCSLAKPLENLVRGRKDDGVLAGASQLYQLVFPETRQARFKVVEPSLPTCQSVFEVFREGKSDPTLSRGRGVLWGDTVSELPFASPHKQLWDVHTTQETSPECTAQPLLSNT